MQGADVAQLRQLAQQFDKAAEDLRGMSSRLTSQINATQAWKGADAGRFKTEWNGQYRNRLTESTLALRDGAKVLLKNADEQEKASEGGTGAVGGQAGSSGGGLLGVLMGLKDTFNAITLNVWRSTPANIIKVARLAPILRAFTWTDEEYLLAAVSGSKWFAADDVMGKLSKTLGGKNWGALVESLGSKLGALGGEGSLLGRLGEGVSGASKVIGPIGKALGPIGVGFTGITAINDFATGHPVRGGLDTAATVLGAAALMTPPPADAICAAGAGAIALGELVYDHWDDITRVGGDVVHGLENAGSTIVHGAENVVDGAVDTAKKLWPF